MKLAAGWTVVLACHRGFYPIPCKVSFGFNFFDERLFCYAGRQATLQYRQTVSYFKALYQQLEQRHCPPEMVAGLWMFIEDIQGRNYLHAYDIYMHLAVGAIHNTLPSL
jgi:hypothetical protein